MRCKEPMKDAYSFDLNDGSKNHIINVLFIFKTFNRMGLKAIPMAADTGPIGGDLSMNCTLADTGESKIYADKNIFEIDLNQYEFSNDP